ncbi:MAG TPA: MBL fold metallo-hydrolase [Thermoleophilaceae bacterium]|nr:MBL fold metallo-hydrolase [Thermoleophilaceae bacterium]
MRLTVLGKSPAWQDIDGACSGYLLQEGDTAVLLDCGNGVFGKLRKFVDYVDVDAVVISHPHADHFIDLVPYSYALIHAPRQQPVPVPPWPGTESPARPRLIVPPGARETFRKVVGAWGNEDLIEQAFELEEYAVGTVVEVGPLRFDFAVMPHFVDAHAVSVTSSNGGGRLAFSADSRPAQELVEFARGADVFLVEATLPRPERSGVRGHLTAEEAGEHGRDAAVGRVVLTHISDELDLEQAVERAAEAFGGPVEVAREGAAYEI